MSALREARGRGGDLRIAAPPRMVLDLMAVLNLQDFFDIFKTVEDARSN